MFTKSKDISEGTRFARGLIAIKMSEEEKKGPGRKPLPDGEVKVRIDIFIKESIVEANGGEK